MSASSWPLAAATLIAAGLGASASPDPLAGYAWKARVLLVAAPTPDDARLCAQRDLFAAMRHGAAERDLALVEAVGDTAEARALRHRFGLAPDTFRALLIGKDGGEKLSSATPLGPDQLFPLIDAMPMRRSEASRS